METNLTNAQKKVHGFLLRHQREHGCPATLVEIKRACGFSTHTGARHHLLALKRKGWVKQLGKGRPYVGIVGDAPPEPFVRLGVFGTKVRDPDEPVECVNVDVAIFGLKPEAAVGLYGIRVADDSMIGAHLAVGDIALFKRSLSVFCGEICVFQIRKARRIRRLCYENDQWSYRAENEKFPAIPFPFPYPNELNVFEVAPV